MTAVPAQAAESPRPSNDVVRLARGVELCGEYESSGFKEPQYLAVRSDGQVVKLSHLLHLVAANTEGGRSFDEVAERASRALGRRVSPANVSYLVENRLAPAGLVVVGPAVDDDPAAPVGRQAPKVAPLLGLKFRAAFVPERLVHSLSGFLRPLFWPPVVVAALLGLVGLDVWLWTVRGELTEAVNEVLLNPALALGFYAWIMASAVFHEIGHATACRYGGARPGAIGAGFYLAWLVFYNNVTDSYRLNRRGRLRTDLGGLYFNVLFILATVAVYAVTGYEPLLLLIVVEQYNMAQEFLPFLRFDGYYVVSDIAGVPDLFGRIVPILKSLVPGRKPDPRVTELRRGPRILVTAWVVFTVPFLVGFLVFVVVAGPRFARMTWEAFWSHVDAVSQGFGQGDVGAGALALLELAMFVVIPFVGTFVTAGWMSKQLGRAGWRRLRQRRRARSAAFAAPVHEAPAAVPTAAQRTWLAWAAQRGVVLPAAVASAVGGAAVAGALAAGVPWPGAVLAALLGAAFAGGWVRADRRVRSRDDLVAELGWSAWPIAVVTAEEIGPVADSWLHPSATGRRGARVAALVPVSPALGSALADAAQRPHQPSAAVRRPGGDESTEQHRGGETEPASGSAGDAAVRVGAPSLLTGEGSKEKLDGPTAIVVPEGTRVRELRAFMVSLHHSEKEPAWALLVPRERRAARSAAEEEPSPGSSPEGAGPARGRSHHQPVGAAPRERRGRRGAESARHGRRRPAAP